MKRIKELPLLPERPRSGHKGTFGTALLVAGSRGMSGAAVLSGLAALRMGSGLVKLAIPENILEIVASVEPSFLTLPQQADRHGRISFFSIGDVLDEATHATATAIGPGLGQSAALRRLVEHLYEKLETPLVVDADGLNNLAGSELLSEQSPHPRVLTPHPGEFSRLTGISTTAIHAQKEQVAFDYARLTGTVIVLKGEGTVVTDGERLFLNDSGNSGMGTGGTGDVLTGIIAALLAQKMEPFEAACLGVHLHGLAGDLAAAELSQPGMIASDLPDYLAEVLAQFTGSDDDE